LDVGRNQVVVGERDSVTAPDCTVHRVNWVSIAPLTGPIQAEVQIRYRSRAVPATIVPIASEEGAIHPGNRVKIIFDEPQFGVTPGQAAVWYESSGRVLGGGIIEPVRA
ncbi:MAG: aminomethyltransferase beta-barrel domain-containing protein, partial [Cyanobacteria bacterium J06597_16]